MKLLRPYHDGQEKVSERSGNAARDDEQKHHDRAVQREESVVGLGVDDRLAASEQLDSQKQRENTAREEREADRRQVHQPDALVVEGG